MSQYDFDLLTIGGGSGGVRASRWASGLGARVAICESNRYGGTCVLRGCIPKKLMLYASELPNQVKYFSSYGWEIGKHKLKWLEQKASRDQELTRLENIYEKLLRNKKVTVLKGHGRIIDPHTVEVNGKKYRTKYILIAVGNKPSFPEIPGVELALSSDDIFEMKSFPSSMLIVGGGYIALEFASIFNGFGSDVTLVFRRDLVLRKFDQELREFFQKEMIKTGVNVEANNNLTQIVKENDKLKVNTKNGKTFLVKAVLFATGRVPNIQNLDLDSVGVKMNEKNEIKVDEHYATSVKSIYALGDCADTPYQLTPVAIAEGMHLAEHLFSGSKKAMNYKQIPTAVFSNPLVAVVGLTEEEAIKKGHQLKIYTSRFRPLKYTVTSIDKKTFMKIIVDRKTDQVLGIHMVGEEASEIIQGMAVALKAGAKKSDFDNTIGIHPTSAEEWVTMREERG